MEDVVCLLTWPFFLQLFLLEVISIRTKAQIMKCLSIAISLSVFQSLGLSRHKIALQTEFSYAVYSNSS